LSKFKFKEGMEVVMGGKVTRVWDDGRVTVMLHATGQLQTFNPEYTKSVFPADDGQRRGKVLE